MVTIEGLRVPPFQPPKDWNPKVSQSFTADWIGLPDPAAQELILRRKPPSLEYLLGTDNLGRDMLYAVLDPRVRYARFRS